jgi:hypothetical protein
MARAFKALGRTKKVTTPEPLLRLVFLYCALDQSLREAAGNFTLLYERITNQLVAERLRACGPWMPALLRTMLCLLCEVELPTGLRFVIIDASSIQAPGATGINYRLPISMDLVTLAFIEILFTDVHTGETLKHFSLVERFVNSHKVILVSCSSETGAVARTRRYGASPGTYNGLTKRSTS